MCDRDTRRLHVNLDLLKTSVEVLADVLASSPVLPCSKSTKTFVAFFDPKDLFFDNENIQFSGPP